MLIKRKRGWEIPASEATPEAVYLNRRALMAGGLVAAGSIALPASAPRAQGQYAKFYPAKRNEGFALDRPVTEEKYTADYNNYYEFGSSKDVTAAARALKTRPWTVTVDGLVEKPFEIGVEDLIEKVTLEERLYRHRCVEAWAMAVPWTGFPMRAFLDIAKPLGSAKYVRFETFRDPKTAPGQRQVWYPWPYIDGLTMAEAANDLTLLVTGIYGKPIANQYGAPLRLIIPWKYGFKAVKAITRISFTEERPKGFWEALQPSEYGFWANVNPQVAHPRWSQASERMLGTDERRPTLLFNGYGEQVASLYSGLEKERLYM